MDKYQMLDEIVLLLDKVADARGIQKCSLLVDITQRIGALKNGLKDEENSKNANIEFLKKQLKDATSPPELKDGEIREGGETYTIDLTPKELRGE